MSARRDDGVRAIPVLGDLTRMDHVERVVAAAETLGPLHVLVHNAAASPTPTTPSWS